MNMSAATIAAAIIIGGCAIATMILRDPWPPLAGIVLVQLLIVLLDELGRRAMER